MKRFLSSLAVAILVVSVACIPEPERFDVPLTTGSPAARAAYLEGRALAENLRFDEARERFRSALDKDPNFASAHLAMANSAATAGDFFEHMRLATELADRASDGERWIIEAARAGLESDPGRQRDLLNRIVEAYPLDPRAHALLGGFYFGEQNYERAIWSMEKATSIDEEFAPPYNLLGYALRFEGRLDEAEAAFRRYIELIPDEPNPYDSYAELLMKLGQFEDSIAQYREALERDPGFAASSTGIALNQLLLGRPDDARNTLVRMLDESAEIGPKRQALTALAALEVHLENAETAVEHLVARRELARNLDDHATVAGDEIAIGTVLLEFGRHEEARSHFEASRTVMERAAVPDPVREAAARTRLYLDVRVAVAVGDLEQARSGVAELRSRTAPGVRLEEQRLGELAGAIALADGDFSTAVRILRSADTQNPRIRYMAALARRELGENEDARELCRSAADFNGPGMDYAFVRGKARALLAEL